MRCYVGVPSVTPTAGECCAIDRAVEKIPEKLRAHAHVAALEAWQSVLHEFRGATLSKRERQLVFLSFLITFPRGIQCGSR
jgi:hypothetical protein